MRLRRHGGGGGRRRRRRRSGDRAAGAARVVAERLPLRHRSERFSQVSTAWEKGGGGGAGATAARFFSLRNLLVNLGLFAAGVWVARNLTDIDLMAPQPVP